MIILTTTSETG